MQIYTNPLGLQHRRIKWDEEKEKNVNKEGSFTVKDTRVSILRDIFEPYLGMTLEEAVQVYEDEH